MLIKETILIVDDDELPSDTIQKVLEAAGHLISCKL